LGLGDGRYLGGNWAAIWNQSEHYNNSQTWFDNLFVRQDLGNQPEQYVAHINMPMIIDLSSL
ncbi:hypothetical protein ONK20_25475, partial [Salmonella enterica subsp. enterica serovar Montevideo]|nr:hypothetical protein [Salmonella enterica subsp. enterica serovar Montevideo]